MPLKKKVSRPGLQVSESRKEYYKDYYQKNKERLRTASRNWCRNHPDKMRAKYVKVKAIKRDQKIRIGVINFLGGKCATCGFLDWRGLQIDHINAGGRKERKKLRLNTIQYYQYVMKNPKGYQILCANCNQIKRYENREYGN